MVLAFTVLAPLPAAFADSPASPGKSGRLMTAGRESGYNILRPDTASGDAAGLNAVPEPASLVLLGTGLLAAGAVQRRKISK